MAELTDEQEAALSLARQAITGEAKSTVIKISGKEYEVPCIIERLIIENGQVDAKFVPVSPVWEIRKEQSHG